MQRVYGKVRWVDSVGYIEILQTAPAYISYRNIRNKYEANKEIGNFLGCDVKV